MSSTTQALQQHQQQHQEVKERMIDSKAIYHLAVGLVYIDLKVMSFVMFSTRQSKRRQTS
jgi:hypothetical protein